MLYKVTKKYQRGSETQVGTFKTINEAKQFIQEKLADDVLHKIDSIYNLYEGMDLLEEFDQRKLVQTTQDDGNSSAPGSAGGGQGQGQTFTPTPFNMTPQPKGMPRSWVKNEDDKKDSDKS